MRNYRTGGVRSNLGDKLQYEGYFSPIVLKRRAQYMKEHQTQEDGQHRDPDNWQKGMSKEDYIDSAWRHFADWWLHHDGFHDEAAEELEEALCALMFNIEGYLFETLKETPCPWCGGSNREHRSVWWKEESGEEHMELCPNLIHKPEEASE